MRSIKKYQSMICVVLAVLLFLCACAHEVPNNMENKSAVGSAAIDTGNMEPDAASTSKTSASESSADASGDEKSAQPFSDDTVDAESSWPAAETSESAAASSESTGEIASVSELPISVNNLITKGSVLLFASDYQHRDGWEDPPVTLNKLLSAVASEGITPSNVLYCGDYTAIPKYNDFNADPGDAIEEIKGICLEHFPSLDTEAMIFEQGNHDKLTDDISASGLHEYNDYLVYVINTQTDFPWGQGKKNRKRTVLKGALRLKQCLDELIIQGEKRPIFLVGHVPLHFSGRTSPLQGTGDNLYSKYFFDVINDAGQTLNLVYLYGHNHSRGWDSYLGGSCVFRKPGDWLLIPEPEKARKVTSQYFVRTLSFTYLNAGYTGYFSSAGGEDSLSCTVCEVYKDHLQFSRFSTDGIHCISAAGAPNPAKDDRKLIPSHYYGSELDSPVSVELKEVPVKLQAVTQDAA